MTPDDLAGRMRDTLLKLEEHGARARACDRAIGQAADQRAPVVEASLPQLRAGTAEAGAGDYEDALVERARLHRIQLS